MLEWLRSILGSDKFSVQPLVPEASTRRFYRVMVTSNGSYMAMHSPPATENNEQFVALSGIFRQHDVPVPSIHAFDQHQGLILVDDFGTVEFLDLYKDPAKRRRVVSLALEALVGIQAVSHQIVPVYTRERLLDELKIFDEWCCEKLLNLNINPVQAIADSLTSEIDDHPKMTVHRDYHCRNLLLQRGSLGIVDFQDALVGSCVYDLASLFHDCYFNHSNEDIANWTAEFQGMLKQTDLPCIEPESAFIRAIELTAIQRSLKATGIFCRLWFTQHKSTHLPFVIPVLQRTSNLAYRNELFELAAWLESDAIPRLTVEIRQLLS